MAHYMPRISQMHEGVAYKMQIVDEKYRMACQTIKNLKSDVMCLENKSKAMAESRYYQDPSEELENLRAELSECQASLAERDRELAWLCEDNERLMTKQSCDVEPHTSRTNSYGCDDDEKAKREREIGVLQFRIEQLTTEKDIVELKLDEALQENETLRKTRDSADNIRRHDSDPDEDSLLSDGSSDHNSCNQPRVSDMYDMIQDKAAHPRAMKLMISALLSKLKAQRRRNRQLAQALEMERERNHRDSEIPKITANSGNSHNEAELNSLLMDRMRLSMALTAEELKNSSLQQALKEAQQKLQRTQNLETELAEQRRHNWDLECERMDVEFEHDRVLRDAVQSIKLMKKTLEAAKAMLLAWNASGQSVSPLLGPDFYQSFEEIGFFLKFVKNYEEEAAKVESKASRRKEAEAKKAEAGGSAIIRDSENSRGPLPNQRYRKVYRNLKRAYDELRCKHDVLICRYQSIKTGLTRVMYQSAVMAVNAALHQQTPQQQQETAIKAAAAAVQQRKKVKCKRRPKKKVAREMPSYEIAL